MLQWPDKDPDAVLDYEMDWSAWLGTDTITASTWIVPAGITKNSDTKSTTATAITLSGGAEGVTYTLTNRIVTAGGRTQDQSVVIAVASR